MVDNSTIDPGEPGSNPGERVVQTCNRDGPPDLRWLHFNDVYHPQEGSEDPVGGAARFKTLCDHYRNDDKYKDSVKALTFFSGDAFNPSKESSVTKGSHMVPILNHIGVDVACAGNHEFGFAHHGFSGPGANHFGEAHFRFLGQECDFPWLISNIMDPNLGDGRALGNSARTWMLEASNGIKIGLMGLMEYQWLEKINNSLPSSIKWESMIDTAKDLGPKLRDEGADIVIALTHARQARDFDFCEKIPEGLIDIVLAGHDHWCEHKTFDNGTLMLRSGTDFKNLSYVEAWRKEDGKKGWEFQIIQRDVVRDIEEDQETKNISQRTVEHIEKKLANRIGFTAQPLEARKNVVRMQESNWGDFVTDLMRFYYDSDCALLPSGTILGDQIYPAGELLLNDIIKCFPFEDPIVVLKVTGQAIWDALENGVSKYPDKTQTRFPQVSGLRFSFNGGAAAGSRIQKVTIRDEDIDRDKSYTMATRANLASGKDGYETLRAEAEGGKAEEVVSEEEGILISTLLRQYFTSLEVTESMKRLGSVGKNKLSQFDSIGAKMSENHPSRQHTDTQKNWKNNYRENENGTGEGYGEDSDDEEHAAADRTISRERESTIIRKVAKKWRRLAGLNDTPAMAEGEEGEFAVGWTQGINPQLDGRIEQVGKFTAMDNAQITAGEKANEAGGAVQSAIQALGDKVKGLMK